MKEKSKKKKMVWQQYIAVIFFMLVGAVCGVLMVKFIETLKMFTVYLRCQI